MEEQRQTVRVDVNAGVTIRIDSQDTVHKAMASRALNTEGIQLLLPGRIHPKERVELEIYLPHHPFPL